jgi:hypothetical protein
MNCIFKRRKQQGKINLFKPKDFLFRPASFRWIEKRKFRPFKPNNHTIKAMTYL